MRIRREYCVSFASGCLVHGDAGVPNAPYGFQYSARAFAMAATPYYLMSTIIALPQRFLRMACKLLFIYVTVCIFMAGLVIIPGNNLQAKERYHAVLGVIN